MNLPRLPAEFHFDCPKCGRPMIGDIAWLHEKIACPDCGESFVPTPRPATQSEVSNSVSLERTPKEQIHHFASYVSWAAAILAVLGAVIFIGALLAAYSAQVTAKEVVWGSGIWIGPALVVFAFMVFIGAQVIHIRANTEE